MGQPREGDWSCADHGVVTPRTDTLIPTCPTCGRMALQAIRERGKSYLVYAEPSPEHCANGHPYGPGRVLLSSYSCAAGHRHRTWQCRTCDDVQQWPACEH